MKLRHALRNSSSPKKNTNKGFALIATLTLMMLLAMLAVTLMAIASSQNRIALQTMLQAEARQQALVGLDAAIGALQVELGPDQRVTASSGVLGSADRTPQHLLGSWNSWDGPIYGKSASGQGDKISSTYKDNRAKMFRRWLISSRDENSTRTMDNAAKLCNRVPGKRVCLVGEGTLGKSLTQQHYVYADLVSMPSMTNRKDVKNESCFAWWVGGENQKAKISVQNPEEASSPEEALSRTWDTPAPLFADSSDLSFLPEKIEEPARVVTMASLPLLGSTSQAAGMPYFFDVTTTSYSLPVNVSMGGLKQDLCLLLNKPTLRGTDFAAREGQDCPLVENDDVPQGTEADMPIGSWQNLHAYYNCWPDGTASDSDNFTARLLGSLKKPYTRMSGSAYNDALNYFDNPDTAKASQNGHTFYDTRAMMEKNSKTSGYARTPVMLAFVSLFGLTTSESAVESEINVYDLDMCFAPVFLWWNPYNVPMRIRGKQLWAQSLPYKTTWMDTYCVSNANTWEYKWNNYLMQQNRYGQDFGDYFQSSLENGTGDIVFEPGEILFFSPGRARLSSDFYKPFSNPWVPGYNPSAVSGYKARFYSGRKVTQPNAPGVPTEDNLNTGKFYVGLRLGQGQSSASRTDGYWFAPQHAECLTVFAGYNGAGAASGADTADNKRGISPHRYILGWYNSENPESNTEICGGKDAEWSADGSQDPKTAPPYFVASVGVVAKSANPSLDGHVLKKDYRGKIWQHSSPAFWGGMLIRPDDQQRQYHPYQLAAMDVSGGLTSCPVDNIGRNGMLGINSDGEQVSFASVLELPVHPPFSLAGLAGMRLQPGWYKSAGSGDYVTQGVMRRMQYQAGVPGVGIGNSFADPCLPAEDVYAYFQNGMEIGQLSSNSRVFGDFYDHGLLINDAMWDRWFCSSVSDIPTAKGKKTAREVLTAFLDGTDPLPVSRYKRVSTPYNNNALVERIMAEDGWKHIAQYLMIDGGFNVNSVSVEAWAAVLQGLAKRKLVTSKNGRLAFVEEGKSDKQVLFSRFMLSTTDKSIDGLGGYSAMQGSTEFRDSGMVSAWSEVRMLEPEGIRLLAEKMVEQVRKRGPFLSMSDFVNRRLETGENGLKGALQAAIDATSINEDFDGATETRISSTHSGSLYKNPEAAKGSVHTAAPGYLIQSDVLASLGNILTVRDDTFTVRAYGCVRNPNKAVLAQAWCEAIVQRTMQYVDPSNNPEDSDYTPEGKKNGKGLSPTNKVMGRQFRIVSFKWLDNWDI